MQVSRASPLPPEGRKECMGHRRYFIRKDPENAGMTKEWIEMDGEEFYRFLQTKEAKGRRFIFLSNNGDDECDEICMEASNKDFMNWKSSDNHQRYYQKKSSGWEHTMLSLSGYVPSNDEEGLTLEEVIVSNAELTEETVIRHMEEEELYVAISKLMYYWESLKLQDIGNVFGTTPQSIYKRLVRIKRILKRFMKIRKF